MLRPGELVAGKYRVERALGQGGMGAVFVAVNERLDKRVALKVLRREVANVPGVAERFTREAISASKVRHPGIVEIYDADVHEGSPWIAMELLEGESLGERLERVRRLAVPEALDIVGQALAALSHVHRAGVLHRDLKPDNLFLEALPEGGRRVKILDFGIAASSGPDQARLTQTGMAIGTPAYFAPEQATGQSDLDGRVDVYAMGVILFESITGELPYSGGSLGEIVMQMFTTGPAHLRERAPHVHPAVASIVDLCLARDRDARVQSVEAMRREIERIRISGLFHAPGAEPGTPVGSPAHVPSPLAVPTRGPVPTPRAEPVSTHPPSRALPLLWLALGGLGALGLVASIAVGIGFYVVRGSEPPAELSSASPPVVAPIEVGESMETLDSVQAVEALPVEAETIEPDDADEGAEAERARARRASARARAARRAPRAPATPTASPPAPPPAAPAAPAPSAAATPSPLSNQQVLRVVHAHEGRLDACLVQAYPDSPRSPVRTEVSLSIAESGRVRDVTVAGGNAMLRACVERVFHGMRFPAHPHASSVRFPMTLTE